VSELEQEYLETHPTSRELHDRGLDCFPSGVTHDARYATPFPIYAERASGTKKWDVDGNEYVDYVMGHGSLLFGYGHDRVRNAFQEQLEKAVHMGTSTELEIEWAELIKELVPCAGDGLVRAYSSGSEAIGMAIRLARIHTGREKVVLQADSYHGKVDQVIPAQNGPPFGMRNVRGIPERVREGLKIVPSNDLAALERALADGDVACAILHCNNLYEEGYVEGMRDLAETYGAVFVMDEVVSGFRYAAGGAQEYYGVTPDLAVLGKIVGGGAPVGAVCGDEEILRYYEIRDDEHWNGFVRIKVGGTWNAQPLSIVGGIAMMRLIAEERETIYPRLYEIGTRLVESFNALAEDHGVTAHAYGLPVENPTQVKLNFFDRPVPPEDVRLFRTGPESFEDYERRQSYVAPEAAHAHYLSTTNDGVYAMHEGRAFTTCTEYSEADLRRTEEAFDRSLRTLRENDLIGRA
jgi:glutamate-1-semialdehyde 2,1-aminomutase